MKRPYLFLCLLGWLPCPLFANAGIFDGGGAAVRLQSTDKIQMVAETVDITLLPADGPVSESLRHRDKARYACRFTFKNLTDETVVAQVGFPLSGEGKVMSTQRYDFHAREGDKDHSVRYEPTDADKKLSRIFMWEMTFEPRATTQLDVDYQMHGYTGAATTRKNLKDFKTRYRKHYLNELEGAYAQLYPYVTQTGNSWAGPIERAVFTLHNESFERYLDERGAFAEEPQSNKKHLMNTLLKNGQRYRHISTGDWNPSPDGSFLRWEASPFAPGEDIYIGYFFTVIPRTPETLGPLMEKIAARYEETRGHLVSATADDHTKSDPRKQETLQRQRETLQRDYAEAFSDADRKNIADAILEFYGVRTGTADIADFLENQSWYPVKNPPPLDAALRVELMKWHDVK